MTFRRIRRLPEHKITFATVAILFCIASACSPWSLEEGHPPLAHTRTMAGTKGEFGEPFGVATSSGTVYVSDGDKDVVWRISPDGPEEFARELDTPSGIAFRADGDLIITDTGSHTILAIDSAGQASILAGNKGTRGLRDGDLSVAEFSGPTGVAVGSGGRIFIADTYNDRIRVIEDGKVSTIAGGSRGFKDGAGEEAMFDTPTGVAIWGDRVLVADTGNGRIRVIENNGVVWTLAGTSASGIQDGLLSAARLFRPTSIAVDPAGSIYFTDGNSIRRIDPMPLASVRTLSNDLRGFQDGPVGRSRFNRPSGLAVASDGSLLVADSDNGLVRQITAGIDGESSSSEQLARLRGDPVAFRNAAPPRWPYDPPETPRDIAGTLGEIRGEIDGTNDRAWFHNGLDIAGAYGETARFIRDEKVLDPQAADNFGTLRELIRMPTLGYIHISLGRDQASTPFEDPRFLFDRDPAGRLIDVRVPRGARFTAGEPIGTLNAMNHVHLVAGRSGYEMNALDALAFPGIADSRPPTIEKVTLLDENWSEFETRGENSRIQLTRKARVVVRAFDQMDGNPERRRLGVYLVGWGLRSESPVMHAVMGEWKFNRLPSPEMVPMLYAPGSRSGADGGTAFNYIVNNSVEGENVREELLDPEKLENGIYVLSVQVADYFGNTTSKDITFEVNK